RPVSPHLYNLAAPPYAEIISLSLELSVMEKQEGHFVITPEYLANMASCFRDLTPEELASIAFPHPVIRLRTDGASGSDFATPNAPNAQDFTVADLARAIEETEWLYRGKTRWEGGVDVHHVFFESLRMEPDGVWYINWGS